MGVLSSGLEHVGPGEQGSRTQPVTGLKNNSSSSLSMSTSPVRTISRKVVSQTHNYLARNHVP